MEFQLEAQTVEEVDAKRRRKTLVKVQSEGGSEIL
jgi:hypothetical protein